MVGWLYAHPCHLILRLLPNVWYESDSLLRISNFTHYLLLFLSCFYCRWPTIWSFCTGYSDSYLIFICIQLRIRVGSKELWLFYFHPTLCWLAKIQSALKVSIILFLLCTEGIWVSDGKMNIRQKFRIQVFISWCLYTDVWNNSWQSAHRSHPIFKWAKVSKQLLLN